jgi:cytochrome P450
MTKNPQEAMLDALPVAPRNPLPLKQQLTAIRIFHTGCETLRDAGGPVTRIEAGPRWLVPEIVVVTSPQGAHDVLGRSDAIVERTRVHGEMRSLIGANLFDVMHDEWLPKRRQLQPLFTKKRVQGYGGQMSHAADSVAEGWRPGTEIDLDAECRKLTLRALGSSVLGLDLDAESDRIGEPLRVMVAHVADRGVAPVRLPGRVSTPARMRARAASAVLRDLAAEVLFATKADANRDAPLVRALIEATDPETGRGLTDEEIRDELIVFMGAGHDTTATTLAYTLWQLGRHPEMQERVRAEAAAVGDRELAPDDVANLGYAMQVLHEALRLCPPAAVSGRLVMQDIDVDGYRVSAGTMVIVGVYAISGTRRCGSGPRRSIPTGSGPRSPRASTAGSSCPSEPGHGPALVTTSPCSKWRWH